MLEAAAECAPARLVVSIWEDRATIPAFDEDLALRQVLTATEAAVLPRPSLFVREAERLFDPAGRLVDQPTREQLMEVLAAFVHWIDRGGGAKSVA